MSPNHSRAIEPRPLIPSAERICRAVLMVAVFVGFGIGLSSLAMWVWEAPRSLVHWMGGMVMRFNTATSIAAAACSLLLWRGIPGRGRALAAAACGMVPLLIGGLTSLEYVAGTNVGIDTLLAPATFPRDDANALVTHPGRMSFNASASLFFLGAALVSMDWSVLRRRDGRRVYLTPMFAMLAALPAICGLVGYLLNASDFKGVLRSTTILFHTALALFVLSVGALAARPDRTPVSRIFSTGADGVLLRWMLPGSTLTMLLLAWVINRGRMADMVAPGEGTALMLYGGFVLLSILLVAASKAVARQEVTARTADAALRDEELRSRAILDTALDGVLLMDAGGRVVDWNRAAEHMFGWRRDEVVGQLLADCVVPAELRAAHQQGLARYLETGESRVLGRRLELPVRRRDGSEFPAEVSVNTVPGAGRPLFVGFVRDITERKAAEQALSDSEQRFRGLADNMSQLAWMTDETGSVVWYNQRWFDYTGSTLADMIGWDWQRVVHPEHVKRVMEKIRDCFDRGVEWEDLFPLRSAAGDYRWFLSRALPIRDPAGKVQRWFGTNTDVTEQRALAEQLERAKLQAEDASRAKDRFLAALSHELRTPLTPALLAATALRKDERLPESARTDLAMIERNIGLESRLIDDLLDLTRITNGKLALRAERCDVHSLLWHAVEIVRGEAEQKGVRIEVQTRAALAGLTGDPARLQQVFWNLLKNAVKFTPAGGSVLASTRNTDGGTRWVLEIRDSGMGFEPAMAEQLFKPFEQGAYSDSHQFGGLGLGLAIAKAVAELHGGMVYAKSPGLQQGATFTVDLPGATEQPTGIQAVPPSNVTGPTKAMRLLLVEDHEATLGVLTRLLTRSGHAVVSANSVATGLQAFHANEIDAVVSDLGLPDGSGFELMASLRKVKPGIRGIALSGYGTEEDIARSREAGFSRHLVKPVDFEQLRQGLAEIQEGAI